MLRVFLKIVDFHFSEIQKIEIPHFANEDLDAAATRGYNPLIRKLMELMNHEQFKRCYDAEILPIDELIVKGNDKFYESIGYGVRDGRRCPRYRNHSKYIRKTRDSLFYYY